MLIESPRVSNQLQACCLPGREHQDSGHMACVKLFVGSSSAQWAVQLGVVTINVWRNDVFVFWYSLNSARSRGAVIGNWGGACCAGT